MSEYAIHLGDCVAWAEGYSGPLFHALLCDAPYHLTTITDRFGDEDSAPAQGGVYARASKGFMGKTWDGGDLAFRPETWAAFMRVLHPGAFIMAFASSRGWHRMAVAIEDAGFIIHPSIFLWAQGQGFPKATRVDTQVDKAAGAERTEITGRTKATGNARGKGAAGHYANGIASMTGEGYEVVKDGWDLTAPATPLARAWEGHRYGGQALKPSVEVIIVAQKPYAEVSCLAVHAATGLTHWRTAKEFKNTPKNRLKVWKKYGVRLPDASFDIHINKVAHRALAPGYENYAAYIVEANRQDRRNPTPPEFALKFDVKKFKEWASDSPVWNQIVTGAGALNIDAGRIGTDDIPSNRWTDNAHPFGGGAGNEYETVTSAGRWPANFILAHSPGCGATCAKCGGRGRVPVDGLTGEQIADLALAQAEQTGEHWRTIYERHFKDCDSCGGSGKGDWQCVDGCAVKALGEQSGESTTPNAITRPKHRRHDPTNWQRKTGDAGLESEGCYGDSGTASRFFYNADYTLNKLEQADSVVYCAKAGRAERDAGLDGMPGFSGEEISGGGGTSHKKADAYQARKSGRQNSHPTLKPLNLTQHLAALLLPPALYAPRRLFVPFSGAGSEMIGAILAGWEVVQGVEIEPEYVEIAQARLKFWGGYKPKPQEKIKPPAQVKIPDGQTSFL